MADPDTIELSPHYYRDNFLRLCDTVEAQYGDILTSAERAMLARYRDLGFKAQCLYVRLISRTGPWFRESKLIYPELGSTRQILDELVAREMALEAGGLSLEDLGKLFTRKELLQAFSGVLATNQFPTKSALLSAIDELQLDETGMREALSVCDPQRLISPLGMDLAEHLQILFFGNRHQSLTEFVLEDLGVTRYFPYPLDRDHRLFHCREAFEEYLACAALGDEHRALLEQGQPEELPELASRMLALTIRFPSSEKRWQKLCNMLARDLERMQQLDTALELYSRSQLHPARERRARILEKRGDLVAADALCIQILSDPWNEAEREAASRILPRVKRKLDGGRHPRRRDVFINVALIMPRGDEPVEQQVATHLRGQWQAVHYVENSLMNTLFGLAFWEQIFEAVPGVFHHPYQSVPADMYDGAFRQRRATSVDARLAELGSQDLGKILPQAYRRYMSYQCRWVDWRQIDEALVETAARIIPAEHLMTIWERMLFDLKENRRGFPDLIAFGDNTGEYCMIEVKGPGDALQDNQKRWLRHFQAQQIPAQVAWVEWQDD